MGSYKLPWLFLLDFSLKPQIYKLPKGKRERQRHKGRNRRWEGPWVRFSCSKSTEATTRHRKFWSYNSDSTNMLNWAQPDWKRIFIKDYFQRSSVDTHWDWRHMDCSLFSLWLIVCVGDQWAVTSFSELKFRNEEKTSFHWLGISDTDCSSNCFKEIEKWGRMLPVLLCSLCLTVGSVLSQGSSQDAFIIQYMERRLVQMEVSGHSIDMHPSQLPLSSWQLLLLPCVCRFTDTLYCTILYCVCV